MRPQLLYLSPVMPAPSGSGLAMRAFHNLRALAEDHDVRLLVIPYGLRVDALGIQVRNLCREIAVLRLCVPVDAPRIAIQRLVRAGVARFGHAPRWPLELRGLSRRRLRAASRVFPEIRFDTIHVFRLYLAPYGFACRSHSARAGPHESPVRLQLDLDEIESRTRRSLGDLHRARGETGEAGRLRGEEELYQQLECRWLPRFDRVFVSSELDGTRLLEGASLPSVRVVPNIATPLIESSAAGRQSDPFILFFVGTLRYAPNLDGVDFLLDEVVPALRARSPRPFHLVVAGDGLSARHRWRLARSPDTTAAGAVSDLAPFYRSAGAALVPIRAGGGTRIKAIEAMSQGVPVVSTAKGVEGLSARPGFEVLIGDSAAAMAEHCGQLMADPALGLRIASAARSYVAREHTEALVHAALLG